MQIPEHTSGGRELLPGQFFDLSVPVQSPGSITVIARARRRSLSLSAPAHYRVELFPPGALQPVAFRDVQGAGLLTLLEYVSQAAGGPWTARVTNCNSHPLYITLEASYPGSAALHPRILPAHLLEALASRLLADTSVHLHHGTNACAVRFPAALGLRDFRFSVPALLRRVAPPLLPELDVYQQLSSISSNSLRLRLLPGSVANPGGTLRMEIGFEEQDEELIGSFPVHFTRMKLLVELDLGVVESRVSYNNIRVSFDFDVDIQPLPLWMYNPMFDFHDRLQEAVSAGIRAAFSDIDTREALSNGFQQGLEPVLGADARVATVQLENGQVSLGLFRPCRAAVA
jgi:hypothetical protein